MSRYIFKDPAKIARLQKVLTLKDNAKTIDVFRTNSGKSLYMLTYRWIYFS